jgi:transcriptional regulator with XRE-family HTH domain
MAAALKAFRLKKGWTQTEIAKRLSVVHSVWSDYEHGKFCPNTIHLEKLKKLGFKYKTFSTLLSKILFLIRNFVKPKPVKMKKEPSIARIRSAERLTPPEGCWIKYQLILRNIKLEDVAKKAHRSISSVSRVVCGVKKSEKVEMALAEMLGYPSYKHLWAAAFINSKKGGAA